MPTVKMIVPVAVNVCYGGFNLSQAAAIEVLRRKNLSHRIEDGFVLVGPTGYRSVEDVFERNDPDILAVVAQMGDAANGPCSKLEIRNVAIDIEVSSYDGKESISVSGYSLG